MPFPTENQIKGSMRKNKKWNGKKDNSGSCRCFFSSVTEQSARREITWSELFDAAVVVTGVDREEVFEPGNVWVWVTASSAEHGGGTGALHHLELRAHIYGGETWGQLILWNTGTPALLHTQTHVRWSCCWNLEEFRGEERHTHTSCPGIGNYLTLIYLSTGRECGLISD